MICILFFLSKTLRSGALGRKTTTNIEATTASKLRLPVKAALFERGGHWSEGQSVGFLLSFALGSAHKCVGCPRPSLHCPTLAIRTLPAVRLYLLEGAMVERVVGLAEFASLHIYTFLCHLAALKGRHDFQTVTCKTLRKCRLLAQGSVGVQDAADLTRSKFQGKSKYLPPTKAFNWTWKTLSKKIRCFAKRVRCSHAS